MDIAGPIIHVKFAKRMPGSQPDVTVFLMHKNTFFVKRCREKDENRAWDRAVLLNGVQVFGYRLTMPKGDCDYGL